MIKKQKTNKKPKTTDKPFLTKCAFAEGKVYYAAYGKNPYRIIFGIDTNQRIAYFFALDSHHSVRKG